MSKTLVICLKCPNFKRHYRDHGHYQPYSHCTVCMCECSTCAIKGITDTRHNHLGWGSFRLVCIMTGISDKNCYRYYWYSVVCSSHNLMQMEYTEILIFSGALHIRGIEISKESINFVYSAQIAWAFNKAISVTKSFFWYLHPWMHTIK